MDGFLHFRCENLGGESRAIRGDGMWILIASFLADNRRNRGNMVQLIGEESKRDANEMWEWDGVRLQTVTKRNHAHILHPSSQLWAAPSLLS